MSWSRSRGTGTFPRCPASEPLVEQPAKRGCRRRVRIVKVEQRGVGQRQHAALADRATGENPARLDRAALIGDERAGQVDRYAAVREREAFAAGVVELELQAPVTEDRRQQDHA